MCVNLKTRSFKSLKRILLFIVLIWGCIKSIEYVLREECKRIGLPKDTQNILGFEFIAEGVIEKNKAVESKAQINTIEEVEIEAREKIQNITNEISKSINIITMSTTPATSSKTMPSTTTTLSATPITSSSTKEENKRICNVIQHQFFPLCQEKLKYLTANWEVGNCFKPVHRIDGSKCSIVDYLTKVEPYCFAETESNQRDDHQIEYAKPRFDLEGLLTLLPEEKYSWMRKRAIQLWKDWLNSIKQFLKRNIKYQKKKVLIILGAFSHQPNFMKNAGKGGPLGELIQWTDLIAGLYVLGYDIEIMMNQTKFRNRFPKGRNGCQPKPANESDPRSDEFIDVIYTDINGIQISSIYYNLGELQRIKCKLRILDSFGTFPEFNYHAYPHKLPNGRSPWGNLNVIPTQFLTLYPHTHDNSFLGFVVGGGKIENFTTTTTRKSQALLYAKRAEYVDHKEIQRYLQIVSEYFEIHATAVNKLPDYIINHGPVTGAKVMELLSESKLFVGVGFPYEGPGPLEAMATGTPYIQPKYDKGRSRLNEPFFGNKPTLRELHSQSPYMEEFVGEPYAFTVNITDETTLREKLQEIKLMEPLEPKIPKEFTNEGMLERIYIFTERMNFCNIEKERWPPIDKLEVVIAELGQSCKDACMAKGLLCEHHFFDDINKKDVIERYGNITCKSIETVIYLHPPSYDPASTVCYLQSNALAYSCSRKHDRYKQICPCRDFEEGQFAVCKGCL